MFRGRPSLTVLKKMTRFSWASNLTVFDGRLQSHVEIEEVLYDFDGPRIFVSSDGSWKYLWYLCDEDTDGFLYLIVPTDDSIVLNLKSGASTVLGALLMPSGFLVETDFSVKIKASWKVRPSQVSKYYLPAPHAMLYASLEPLLSVRLVGEQLVPGHVPASAVKRGIDGAYGALKKLGEAAVEISSLGRPGQSLRQLFDLPIQRMAFGSVEISFASQRSYQGELLPNKDIIEKIEKMGELLSVGLKWACNRDSALASRPILAVLEALEKLAPPMDGAIQRVEVRGKMLQSRIEYTLDRKSSKIVRAAISHERSAKSEKIRLIEGYVRELDVDKQTFILRDTEGNDLANFICDEYAYDDIYNAFIEQQFVQVAGRPIRGKSQLEALIVSAEILSDDSLEGED